MHALDSLTTWQLVGLAATLGWASGVRLYAVLFIVGGLGYLGWIPLPGGLVALAHPYVLVASGFMCVVEFCADKSPGVDTAWDFVQTFVRIPAGAALAAGSHLAKSGSRMLINTSPEPFSNWAASFGEDLAIGTLLWLTFAYPLAALVVLAVLIALMIWLLPKVWRAIRALLRRIAALFGHLSTGSGR
jgi:hypothetical protein